MYGGTSFVERHFVEFDVKKSVLHLHSLKAQFLDITYKTARQASRFCGVCHACSQNLYATSLPSCAALGHVDFQASYMLSLIHI